MGRARRPDHEGLFHVTARSIAEERIFRCEADYLCGIDVLARLVRENEVACHAFCLMPTHYHVVASFPAHALAPAVQRLNRRYAVVFNARHRRRGHVFDSPYAAIPVETDEHFQILAAYLAHNPRDRATWRWSSYLGAIGARRPFSFVDDAYVRRFGSPHALEAWVEAWRPTPRDLALIRGRPTASRRGPPVPGTRHGNAPSA
jgi:hypothetical protein